MKILTATKKSQGQRDNDFCWTEEGEIVTFGSECDCEEIDGTCGCRRSMTGVISRKATTTMLVVDREIPIEELAAMLVKSDYAAGFELTRAESRQEADRLAQVAELFNVGDVVERRGNDLLIREVVS